MVTTDRVIEITHTMEKCGKLMKLMKLTAGSGSGAYRGGGARARSLRLAYGVLLFLPLLASADKPTLVPLSSAELQALRSKLDPKLLPGGNRNLEVDRKQSFRLIQEGQPELDLVPVRFDTPIPHTTGARVNCGVYLLKQNVPGKFFWTLGSDTELPFNCLHLDAVGIQPFKNDKPAIIFLYSTEDPGPHEPMRWPYVLSWDDHSKEYVIPDAWERT